jgi:hypothetical protein
LKSIEIPYPLPPQVVAVLARREVRMHHFLFHEIRHWWLSYPPDVQQKLRDQGWEPPRPAWDENGIPITDNDSGEDFLYMHRELVNRLNAILGELGDPSYPRVEGWVALPSPADPDYPVPPAWFTPEAHPFVNQFNFRAKLPINFKRRFEYWQQLCMDPGFLSTISLGHLGSIVEETLFDGVRARWAAPPGAWRNDPAPGEFDAIPVGFDDPRYDFLRDTYAMHVNPIYWKFFGWVDDRIEDWKIANGVFGNNFWNATWVGQMPELDTRSPSDE